MTPHLNPPLQRRSQRTLERIVRASVDILATEGPSALTVNAVVARAESSVGSFYARFPGGKDDLLEYLADQQWHDALERWNESLSSKDWSDLELRRLIDGAVGLLVDAGRSRARVLGALDQARGTSGDAYATFQRHLLSGLADLLLVHRAEIEHPEPALAVSVGLRAVMGLVDADAARGEEALGRDLLTREGAELLARYLMGVDVGSGGAGDVDFFEVWG